ncbi:pyridoxamine 5'-phosphate oxidase family protein [Streptomyces sp. SID3343]|uniref:pyridoxamine 5'-phosphate oxidase family protein n=1 Tax=Streptomyces sp. SID3343 TaxID=2690260 RepID=UPI00136D40AB|nr:pyridoxamine 5'-phosphate oxidase family protein [Streptomyces sp. SID3343]MYW04640.1 pyridoxamine 5'-phosphate oxidase [Streptomyces sp. SID3343]
MTEAPRTPEQRKKDALAHLAADKDLWVSTADAKGNPCLVPLSFWWNGTSIFIATVRTNQTGQNIVTTGRARVALGHTRDVVLIEASALLVENDDLATEYSDAYAEKCGWNPRESANYRFYRFDPQRIESWRELNEHEDRELLRAGEWLI